VSPIFLTPSLESLPTSPSANLDAVVVEEDVEAPISQFTTRGAASTSSPTSSLLPSTLDAVRDDEGG
jgi:hypothetical protein